MTAERLCALGGYLLSVKDSDGKRNVAWTAHAPEGMRFTNGRHVVRRELDQSWEDVMGYLGLETCGPGCSCFRRADP